MTSDEILKAKVGKDVAKLMKGQKVKYLNPVAKEREELMRKYFNYAPLVVDAFTLKPNN